MPKIIIKTRKNGGDTVIQEHEVTAEQAERINALFDKMQERKDAMRRKIIAKSEHSNEPL